MLAHAAFLRSLSRRSMVMPSHRIRFFQVHLAASAVVALLALSLVFGIWYPDPLHTAVGVTHVFALLIAVDVVIGPCLTLLVYKRGKPSLAFDLSVIVLLQLFAFLYGIWTVAEGRPAWLVFNADRFDLVRVVDIDERDIDSAMAEYRSAPLLGPRWVAAQRPESVEARNAILFEALSTGVDLAQRPQYYRPLAFAASMIRKRAKPLGELNDCNPPTAVSEVLQQWPVADAWLPLMSNAVAVIVLVRTDTGEVVGLADLRPWCSD